MSAMYFYYPVSCVSASSLRISQVVLVCAEYSEVAPEAAFLYTVEIMAISGSDVTIKFITKDKVYAPPAGYYKSGPERIEMEDAPYTYIVPASVIMGNMPSS